MLLLLLLLLPLSQLRGLSPLVAEGLNGLILLAFSPLLMPCALAVNLRVSSLRASLARLASTVVMALFSSLPAAQMPRAVARSCLRSR